VAVLGDLVVNLTANSSSFRRHMNEAKTVTSQLGTTAMKTGQQTAAGIGQAEVSVMKLGAQFMAAHAALNLVRQGWARLLGLLQSSIEASATVEQLQMSFEVLIGSASGAADMMERLRDFAARTPFQIEGIAQATKLLLNAGVATSDIVDRLEVLGNLASSAGIPLEQVARVFGQIRAAGKLMGNDFRQLNDAGIPMMEGLRIATGKTNEEIIKMREAGELTFPVVLAAFEALGGEAGRLGGMMERQSQTLGGLWTTWKDAVFALSKEFGDFIVQNFNLKDGLKGMIDVVQNRVVPQMKEMFELVGPMAGHLASMAMEAAKAGGQLMLAFGDALIAGLKAAKPLIEFITDAMEHLAKSAELLTDGLTDMVNKARELMGKGAAAAPAGNIVPDGLVNNLLGISGFDVGTVTPGPVDPGPGFMDAGGLGIQPGVNGGAVIPGEVPGVMIEAIPKAIQDGFVNAGELIPEAVRDSAVQFAGAAERGSQEAYQIIARNVFGGKSNVPQDQLNEAKKTNQLLAEQIQLEKQKKFGGKGMVVSEFK